MLRGFICPDNQQVNKEDCWQKCRIGQRCLTLPTLVAIGTDREWSGKPSTTQCINGTRLEFLKLTKDYYIDPYDRAFALLGTRHHEMLEAVSEKLNVLSEEKLGDEVTGILDLIEPDGDSYILSDYKTAGSYKVASAIGMIKVGKIPDPSGECYRSTGKWGKAGSPKMIDKFGINPDMANMQDWVLQLNNYRLLIESAGFPVSRIQIQATVRDGGTIVAKSRGITENIYMIPVKRLDDADVKDYFIDKSVALITAMETQQMPEPCSEQERWNGRRCKQYCEVWEHCELGQDAHMATM
ncbi:MAG: hypothetical protein H8E40_07555 [Chloroflexi bacterium]|nr:hypothetical protein [Chloroflexota bacterium]